MKMRLWYIAAYVSVMVLKFLQNYHELLALLAIVWKCHKYMQHCTLKANEAEIPG